jgi:endonuclease YncB( thermonuclease family)
MKRRTVLGGIGASISAIAFNSRDRRSVAQELPEGVPAESEPATVTDFIDGDKFVVEIGGRDETVLMISANAPEEGRCFFNASSKHLRELIPRGTEVYLERDGEDRDGKDRLLRYVWLPREGKKAQFIDERMIADGYSRFTLREGHSKRDARLKKAEKIAKSEKRGMWADGACSGGSASTEQEQAGSTEDGESGFSQGLGQSRNDWEAVHGEPNPEFTQGDSFVYYGVRNNYMIVMYIDENIHSISGVTPNLQVSDAEAFLLAFAPHDAVLLEQYTSTGGLITSVYYSESLISRINEGFWFNAEPGVFITGYHVSPETGLAESWLVATGNNP